MAQLSDLPTEIIDQIIGYLPRSDRLKLLLRLSKVFSTYLETSDWWRKELQLEIGPVNPHKYINKDNVWREFYFSHRSGWAGLADFNAFNHRTLPFSDCIGCNTAFFDGFQIIYGDAFWFIDSRDLRIFDISTTKVHIIDPETLSSAGWTLPTSTAAYFENILVCCSKAEVLFYEIDTSMSTIKRLTYDHVPVIDGEALHISISKTYVCFLISGYPNKFLTVWNRRSFATHTIRVAEAESLSIHGEIIVGASINRVRSDGKYTMGSASYWTSENNKEKASYNVVSFGRENISYPYRPTRHEVHTARNGLEPKQILSKLQELMKRDRMLAEWKGEQPSKISLLKYAGPFELTDDDKVRDYKKLDNNYVPFLDKTGRYIALGKQSGWTKAENLLEIFIWDVLYCKEASKLRCTVPRELGLLETGIVNFGIILVFLRNGIVRIKQGGAIPEALHRSSWEQLGISISIKECTRFSLFMSGVSQWGAEPHNDPFQGVRDVYYI